ncbi:uncharacterized protein LOC114518885 [Dendronephthya gigantea]|uniref:uncharacterized protein LOC114518885 n=1 Tax=Dendronephthya gigantea TaxID=151771 RepID=UPI001068EA7D|nr:uncharacterized protein LOC114518885 [Dendronephthya gigantea]
MAYDSGSEEEMDWSFLCEDSPEGVDEVDAVSNQVINFESETSYMPKYFVDSNNRAVKKETRRLRTVSEKILKTFGNIPYLQNGMAALLKFSDEVDSKQLLTALRDVCNEVVFEVLYHNSNLAIVYMNATSYTFIGEKIMNGNGFKMQDMFVTHLEALCLDPLPRFLVEISTPKSTGEAFQRELSAVLVTFRGSFKYLRLHEGDEPDMEPSVSVTLLFSKRAQRNADKFQALLCEKNTSWKRYERPEAVRVPYEQLFSSRNHSSLVLGIICGNDIPGVRISVMFSSMKDEMIKFYSVLTGMSPVCRSDNNGTSYLKYPVARNLELQLIHNSTIPTNPSSNVAICVRVKDHEKISASLESHHQSLTSSDEGHWETCDPVGNRVLLFTPFE